MSAADRFDLLAAIGTVADGTRSLDETVHRLLDIVVPAFADVALLDALGSRGEIRPLGARVADPTDEGLGRTLLERRRSSAESSGVPRANATDQAILMAPVGEEHLRGLAAGEEDYRLLASLGLRCAMFIPLQARGATIGALACAVGASGRGYDEEDLHFAQVLSGRIALALDNAGLSERITGLERRLEATLANLAEAVIVRDADGAMVFANAAAADLLEIGPLELVTASSSQELMDQFEAFDERGNRLSLSDLPSSVALRGEQPAPMLVRNVIRATGRERWLLHKATPVFDPDGQLSIVVNVVEDVTEVKRAELTQRLLAQAGEVLSSSLDYEQTLQRVAQLAVPGLADFCGVVMRGQRDVLEQVAVAHVDPGKVALARELGERHPLRLSDPGGSAEVIRTGAPRMISEMTDELLGAAGMEPDQLSRVRSLGVRSVMIVPLAIAGQRPLGAMSLVMAESGRTFDDDDLALAEELARRATIAVENARLYTERSRIAETLQRSLLPPVLPEIPRFRLASLYRAAGEQTEVGGDFYDAFPVPSGWIVVVGDVAGRGAEAAALTSMSRYTLRTASKLLDDPVAAVQQLNRSLRERPVLSMVSVCCALIHELDGAVQAQVVLAGHPPPLHLRRGEPHAVGVLAPVLGIYDDATWRAELVTLDAGDQLVLYTDGVIDAAGDQERFGEERLARALTGSTSAPDSVQLIEDALASFARGPQVDDTAVLVIEAVAAGVVGLAE